MAFVRWVFYDDTGAVQYVGMQRGNFKRISADDMAAALGLTNYACMETQPLKQHLNLWTRTAIRAL